MDQEEVASSVRVGSIKQAMQSRAKKVEVVQQEVKTAVELEVVSSSVAIEALKDYAGQLKKQGKRALAAYLADPMLEVVEGKMTFTVGSKTLERDIHDHWPMIQNSLKEKGAKASLELILDPQKVQEYKLFTPQEQFDALCKEYPKLSEFRERFGLDLEL